MSKNGKKTTKETAIAKITTDQLPDVFKPDKSGVAAGMENVDTSDIILARVGIVQEMSKCVDPEDKTAPRPGQFLNNITMKTYEAPITIIPLFYNKAAVLFPDEPGDPVECSSRDGKTGRMYGTCNECEYNYAASWVNNEPPRCRAVHEFISLFADDDPENSIPFVITMMKSSYKTGQQLITLATSKPGMPWCYAKYEIGKEYIKNDKGKFYIYTVRPAGLNSNLEAYADIYTMIKSAYNKGIVAQDFDESPDKISDDSFDTESFK